MLSPQHYPDQGLARFGPAPSVRHPSSPLAGSDNMPAPRYAQGPSGRVLDMFVDQALNGQEHRPQSPASLAYQQYIDETSTQSFGGLDYSSHHDQQSLSQSPTISSYQPYNDHGVLPESSRGFPHLQENGENLKQPPDGFSDQPHDQTPTALAPQCLGCLSKNPNDSQSLNAAPGPIYQLHPCDHHMCRSCLTISHFPDNTQAQCLYGRLRLDDAYLLAPQHRNTLSQDQANTAILLSHKADSVLAWNAVYQMACRFHTPASLSFNGLDHEFLAQTIESCISACSFPRLTTPALLYEELGITLQDVAFWYMAKRPGSKYALVGKYFDGTDDPERDFRGVCLLVGGIKDRDAEVKRGMGVWEGVLKCYVGVLAMQWWERFA
jgi:hypothetical protein